MLNVCRLSGIMDVDCLLSINGAIIYTCIANYCKFMGVDTGRGGGAFRAEALALPPSTLYNRHGKHKVMIVA